MNDYITVIGLEIHAELLTNSKVFCTCGALFGGEENTRVCPRCSGMPGTLPVFNRGAATLAVRAGLALNCKIHNYSAFDRKNYFYPDLPKAYQITQFYYPICTDGAVDIGGKKIRINRIHIEEDAGKLTHDDYEGVSYADYNRCGVPLIEIVTEPDISGAEEARALTEEIAARLKYAGVSDSKMEQGSLRCDVNISLMRPGDSEFGTRTEIKNLNSFKSIVRAIEYERQRQAELLDRGKPVIQQTLHFNENRGTTKPLRSKEEAHDYRYFPEPDLPPIYLSDEDIGEIRASQPEMPDARFSRYTVVYGLPEADARLLISDKDLSDFYDRAVAVYPAYKPIANMATVELLRRLNLAGETAGDLKFTPEDFAELVRLSQDGKISKNAAKEILRIMYEEGGKPEQIAESRGYLTVEDSGALREAIRKVMDENGKAVGEYRAGSEKVFGFLMGRVCAKVGKSANPQTVRAELLKALKG